MCLVGVVVRRYIDFNILLIPTPLVSALLQQHPYSLFIFLFFVLVPVAIYIFEIYLIIFTHSTCISKHKDDYGRPTEAV